MSTDGQRIKWSRNIAANFNCLSTVHERYRRQTDRRQSDRQTVDRRTDDNSEREREFTFTNDLNVALLQVPDD